MAPSKQTSKKTSKQSPSMPSTGQFYRRLARNAIVGFVFIFGSLAIGTIGYHLFMSLPWIDSLLNASMILTGMGPVDHAETTAAKLFASAYAIFSGVAFLGSVGVLLAPLAHRLMHRYHLETEEEEEKDAGTA